MDDLEASTWVMDIIAHLPHSGHRETLSAFHAYVLRGDIKPGVIENAFDAGYEWLAIEWWLPYEYDDTVGAYEDWARRKLRERGVIPPRSLA
jgi:hypothetical protein